MRKKRGLVPSVVLFLIAHCSSLIACTRPDPEAALERAVRAYYLGMASTDAADNRRAMDGLALTRADAEALFADRAAAVWAVWGPERETLVRDAARNAEHYRTVLPLGAVRSEDLRVSPGSVVLERSLQELPAGVPARAVWVEVSGHERQRGASAFLFVRGRWVWMWDLERLGAVLAAAPPAATPAP